MRLAVSGSHGTGKSTLIAALLDSRPDYQHEPEAYEALADEIPLASSEGPSLEGLESLIEHTVAVVASHGTGSRVVFERSPVDYLAYATASHDAWTRASAAGFVEAHLPRVRESLRHLDVIAYLPLSPDGPVAARAGEDEAFRSRVDEMLRRALIDDEYELFAGTSPEVLELSPLPQLQMAELLGRIGAEDPG
jgi:hypothetical protein